MTVDGQVGSQRTDGEIGMLHEIGLSLEALLTTMGGSLLQNLVIALITEGQAILTEIVGDVLGNRQVHLLAILRLHVLIDHLLAITHDTLHEHLLYLGVGRGQRELFVEGGLR